MIKGLVHTVVIASLSAYVFFTSSDIESTLKQELGSGANPYKHVDRSPDFVKRSIASLSDDVTARALKKRRVEDMHMYKSYEESLSKLKGCMRTICQEYFTSEEVSENYDKYGDFVTAKINENINQLYNFTLKRGFRSHSIITTALDFIDLGNEDLKKNLVLLLSTQRSDLRSLNALIELSQGVYGKDLHSLIILELEKYAVSKEFKDKVSDQIVTVLASNRSNENSLITKELYRFINKDNLQKFNHLLTKIPNESRVYSQLANHIEKFESTNL